MLIVVIKPVLRAGCRNLQFDDCLGTVVGSAAKLRYKALDIDLDTVKQLLECSSHAKKTNITSHICRGNYNSTYFSSGAYDSVADYVFARENVNALLRV